MGSDKSKSFWRAFLDFFVLFSGVSTASNLARTQGRPLRTRGLFLFRSRKKTTDAPPGNGAVSAWISIDYGAALIRRGCLPTLN